MHPYMQKMMERSASGDLRWNVTLFPTNAYAAEAGMSLRDYEDFYYRACLCDQPDPVAAWEQAAAETIRLAEWTEGHEEVHIQGPGTDLKLNVSGRHFKPADGKYNMPDGEFFTGPVEDSAEGEITFHLPATYAGREVAGVHFRFEGGKVVDATAERGEDFLIEMLDTDEGARRLGELGIGTNFGIDFGTGEILLDEKIGGTVHLAVGESYPETGGVNSSAIHWDMICDLRKGGSITVDGELLQEDGKFVKYSGRESSTRMRRGIAVRSLALGGMWPLGKGVIGWWTSREVGRSRRRLQRRDALAANSPQVEEADLRSGAPDPRIKRAAQLFPVGAVLPPRSQIRQSILGRLRELPSNVPDVDRGVDTTGPRPPVGSVVVVL